MGGYSFGTGIPTWNGIPMIGGAPLFTGSHFFVDPVNGSDGNTGKSPGKAFQTLSKAYTACTSGKNDVVYLIGDGGTTATARITTTTLTWAKNATHLIGITAPSRNFQRARISHSSTAATGVSPLLTFSASGCFVANVSLFSGYSTDEDQSCMLLSGSRNNFANVHFGGGGHLTPAARAGTNSVTITAGSENLFNRCTFGLTSILSSAANASLVITESNLCRDNYWEDCDFIKWTDDAAGVHVNVGSASLLGFMTFNRCRFLNNVGTSGGTAMTAALTVSATCGGDVILHDPMFVGATDITAADSARTHVLGHGANPSGNLNIGLSVTTDVS